MSETCRVEVWWDEHSDPNNKGWVAAYFEENEEFGGLTQGDQTTIEQPRPNWRAACHEALRWGGLSCHEFTAPMRADRPDVELYIMEREK